jgi:hypothetical protein
MELKKSAMTVDGNSVRLSMPFAKVDEAQRLVSGYATLDNIDTQGDIVLADASKKAFSRARGNIREMHQPIAVGKMVDFVEDEYFDKDSNQFYRGIFVTARVSEGAEDTWKKVLDGTLTGFSIGGEVNDSSNDFNKDAGKTVRYIKDYDLTELSLVDNPANQLANVLSIQKSATGTVTLEGMAAETVIENVFICKTDETVVVKDVDSHDCPMCGTKMENAGWFEAGSNRTEKVADIVTKFLKPVVEEAAPTSEGGAEVVTVNKSDQTPVPEAKETSVPNPSETQPDGTPFEDKAAATVEDEQAAAEVDETEGTETGEEAAAETPDEVHDEGDEISKKIDDLHDAVKKTVNDSKEETLAKVAELEGKIDEALTKAFELENKFSEFGPKLEAMKARTAELEKKFDKVNAADAFKKSADVSTVESTQKEDSFWGGSLY